MVLLDARYWECKCPDNYIFHIRTDKCDKCGEERKEYQPGVRAEEIEAVAVAHCSLCGRYIVNGEDIYATCIGVASNETEGFINSSAGWLTEACYDCGNRCSLAIANIS